MWALPATARALVMGAVLAAALCAAPALRAGAGVPWAAVALLAAVGAAAERLPRRSLALPVLLTAAFVLPPAAAALVAVPGALVGRVERPPVATRRLWHAAQQSLAVWAASSVFAAFSPLPGLHALPPALTAALVCALVLTVLDGAIQVAAEHRPFSALLSGLPTGLLGPTLVHGPAALLAAILWRGAYGPAAALLVLLPMALSGWLLDSGRRERAAQQEAVRALVQAVDLKDRYTRAHCERVGRASVLIARELGMTGERLETMRLAGVLHDIGKIGVPTRLLRKDGPLTPEERRVIELHPEYGHEIVRGIAFLDEARAAILHHHERLDGTGYPHGLTGHHIPESARVVAVADAFDAMTSNRSYSRARPVPVALAELHRCAGSHFDPRMVAALTRALDRRGWGLVVPADASDLAVPVSRNVPSGCSADAAVGRGGER
ncbi:HD-GYP domain-containing protein [Streptomyces sp. QH1-20]|uniref:HD-GYP domain-containing protein n=1 Tax=Streptomyces sp. QH1-20 TaxID=3240934 RepID=UPI0035197909